MTYIDFGFQMIRDETQLDWRCLPCDARYSLASRTSAAQSVLQHVVPLVVRMKVIRCKRELRLVGILDKLLSQQGQDLIILQSTAYSLWI